MAVKKPGQSVESAATIAPHEAKIEITVKVFRPIGSVTTTTVDMNLVGGKPVEGQPEAVTDGVVKLLGNYYIKVKKWKGPGSGEAQPVKITFSIKNRDVEGNDEYLLQAIAFSNREQGNRKNHLGQREFPRVELVTTHDIEGKNLVRKMTITNQRHNPHANESYDYLIVLQNVRQDGNGAFGIIDPEIENECV